MILRRFCANLIGKNSKKPIRAIYITAQIVNLTTVQNVVIATNGRLVAKKTVVIFHLGFVVFGGLILPTTRSIRGIVQSAHPVLLMTSAANAIFVVTAYVIIVLIVL